MKRKKQKIEYDKDANVLSIELQAQKSVDSDMQGNAVIDYGKKGEVVRINLYDFNFNDFRAAKKAFQEFSKDADISALAR